METKLEFDYEEVKKITDKIEDKKCSILLQFPDGLKPKSKDIYKYFKKKLPKAEIYLWLGSCYGACDVPYANVDHIVQFGHSKWC